MDRSLATLDRHVAQAADAWLTDPRDAGVYARLVRAIEARRRYLHPTLDEQTSDGTTAVDEGDPLAEPDDRASDDGAVKPVGAGLTGDPAVVLGRLRGAS